MSYQIIRIAILCFSFFTLQVYCTTSQAQIDALGDFYNSTGGDHWFNNAGWNVGDPCDWQTPWFGIYCQNLTATASYIFQINLPQNNLTGTLPATLGNLTDLSYIYLNLNSLSGTIPTYFCNYTKMTIIILSNNHFTGQIPDCIGDLNATLTYLDLSLNGLSGAIPNYLFNLTLLTNLLLDSNYNSSQLQSTGLSGSLPDTISNLKNLKVFHTDSNRLTGTIPDALWTLTGLSELYLGTNLFTGTLSPNVSNLTQLTQFECSNTKLTGQIPSTLWDLTSLTILNIGLNEFTGTLPEAIGNLTSLTQLNLKSSPSSNQYQLSGTLPDSIWTLVHLQFFYFSYNKFEGTLPESITNFVNLTIFDASSNLLNGTVPSDFYLLPQLNTVFLSNNKFTGTLPESFPNYDKLLNIQLNNNLFSGTVPSYFQNSSNSLGSSILTANPLLCPVYPSWATDDPLSATCEYWKIESVKPGYVSTAGGSEITITGTQFINYIDGIQCVFGNSSADNFNDATAVPATVVNATTIQCVTPPHLPTSPPFSVSIWYNSLLNPASNGSLTFIFETTPTTNYTFPSNSPSYGGGVVYVYGADFSNTDLYDSLLCRFNENITTAKYYNSSTISCDIPPQPLGLSSFSVSNDNGTSWSPQNVTIAIYAYCPLYTGESICNDHGFCDNVTDVTNPHCICYGNFTGSNCQNCTEGHWGANCTVCPACVYGTCNQYVEGNGKCNCDWQYAGDLCTIHWWYYFLFCLLLTICFTVAFIITWCSVRLCFAICKKRAEKKKKMRIKQGINHESDPILVQQESYVPEVEDSREVEIVQPAASLYQSVEVPPPVPVKEEEIVLPPPDVNDAPISSNLFNGFDDDPYYSRN